MCRDSRVDIFPDLKNQGSTGQGDEFQSDTVLRYSGTMCLSLVSRARMWYLIKPWRLAQLDAGQGARSWDRGDRIRER